VVARNCSISTGDEGNGRNEVWLPSLLFMFYT
jgi:hypothetical protein